MTDTIIPGSRSETELALWMLDRMRESASFLEVIRDARVAGRRDPLDLPDYITAHKQRLKPLHDGDEAVDAPPALAARIEALAGRDVLPSGEALIEAAMMLYLEAQARSGKAMDVAMRSPLEAARDEIEGRTRGDFRAGFVAGLAAAARAEMDREAVVVRERDQRERE